MIDASSQPGSLVFTGALHRIRRGNGHSFELGEAPKPPAPVRKPARVARMLAFAHGIKQAEKGDADASPDLILHDVHRVGGNGNEVCPSGLQLLRGCAKP